ncbi:DUF2334 domain-containing protein [Burkholderia sp. Bp9140]|uniref:polysaccharide deacetylase family protein n=1 Tax=Burkholderia sp. Bp9140 TaxID=2184572 RepID=UPI000F58C9D4|nr:polysaccharide deacetylase family protein [Burkholderia sp. Bp9140]RQR51309.1 DUF2334 domain-containing protein [Burkholderia sp. Bp9140]
MCWSIECFLIFLTSVDLPVIHLTMNHFKIESGWGPDRKPAALTISFDNLGEAALLEMGLWDKPIGQHYTAAFVPSLIEVLGDVPATYFIEASNTLLYPEAIQNWHRAGHEVGLHGWRHEAWDRTDAQDRRRILRQSLDAMRALGIAPVGFRPPGGTLPREAYAEFAEAGLLYCSDLREPVTAVIDGIVSVPFEWRNVDVFVLEEVAKPLRVAFGDQEQPFSVDYWAAILDNTVNAALIEGGQRTVVFHPEFLAVSDEKLCALKHLLQLAKKADMWLARGVDVAKFVRGEMVAKS